MIGMMPHTMLVVLGLAKAPNMYTSKIPLVIIS